MRGQIESFSGTTTPPRAVRCVSSFSRVAGRQHQGFESLLLLSGHQRRQLAISR